MHKLLCKHITYTVSYIGFSNFLNFSVYIVSNFILFLCTYIKQEFLSITDDVTRSMYRTHCRHISMLMMTNCLYMSFE